MKTLFSRVLFPLSLLIGLVACDPAVEYSMVLQNDSDYDLVLFPRDTVPQWSELFFDRDSAILAQQTEIILSRFSEIGSPGNYENCPYYADSLIVEVKTDPSLQVTTDVSNPTGWVYTLLESYRFGGGVCECRLTITNAMIQ